jgi:PKD repeat protein
LSKTTRRCTLALIASIALMALVAAPAQATPTADFTVSANPQSGVPVTFTSTSTAPAPFAITGTQWSINGVPATTATVEHTFATAGSYTVSLTVTSNELVLNEDTETKTVTVATRPPTANFIFNPVSPLVNEDVLFASNSSDPDNEALTHTWTFGDGGFASGPSSTVTHDYATPGTKTARLEVNDGHGGVDDVTKPIVVRDPSAATASFTISPENPVENQAVAFTSTSTPSAGQTITALDWDLDSDGQYDDAHGKDAARSFDSRGVYRVALRVRQANGNTSVAEGTVRVGGLPVATPPGITPPGDTPNTPSRIGGMRLLSPFPVVRLVGKAYPRRTVVTLLSVRAPRGSLTRVRCRGRGCPKVVRRKRAKGKLLRFKTFERSIRAGARLEVFVVRSGRVGKFTRFKMRRGNFPVRSDACLVPGRRKPRPCPS